MRVLLAIKGSEGEGFFRRAAALTPLLEAEEILLAHVIDTKARDELELGRERFLARRPLGDRRSAELTRAEEEQARAALQFARQALVELGVPEARLEEIVLRGKPNEELRKLAEARSVDLIVVAGRGGKPGPHSIGKTSRFLIDHAPRAVLMIRTRSHPD
jgi:nucleotide-binding universal stress UspA family protein